MGRLKQLLPLDGKPVIRHCIDSILAADIHDIVVVIRRYGGELSKALDGLPVKRVLNENPASEMSGSIRIGLRAADHSSSGVMVNLSDQPLISAETIKTLVKLHSETPGRIIVPQYGNKKGHPVLFPRHVIEEIFTGITLRDIVKRDPERVRMVSVMDEGVIIDIDSMEDYERAVLKYAARFQMRVDTR
jgi:molybdenum cofactor cytidylyltransferase